MRWRREFNVNRVTAPDFAADQNYAHDSGFTDEIPIHMALEGRLHQTRPNALEAECMGWADQSR